MTNRKSYTGFPTSYRWSAYVTSKSPTPLRSTDFYFYYYSAGGTTICRQLYCKGPL